MRKLMVGMVHCLSFCVVLLVLPAIAASQPTQLSETWLKWPASGQISANVAWHLQVEGVWGVDIANREGTPIAAAHSGTVTFAG